MDFKSLIFTKYIRSLYNVNLEKSNVVHRTLITAIYKVFIEMEDDIDKMKLEICLTTATGKWLDLWGEYFGIARRDGELDKFYSQRIIAEVIEPKATLTALKKAAARWVNFTYDENYDYTQIEAYEPWQDLMVTSQRGNLSVFARLPDSVYWTPALVDMAIPDASEMSLDLIMYLNTIKAAGVQLVWHRTMNWEMMTGLFESDSIDIWIQNYYDIYLKRRNEVTEGFRTANEWSYKDKDFNTPLSVRGKLSGNKLLWWEIELYRDLDPYRYLPKIVHESPTISLGMFADILGVDFDRLTLEQMIKLEFDADEQIPNLDNRGKSFKEEIKPYLDTNIEGICYELEENSIEVLQNSTVAQVIEKFNYDEDGLKAFLEDWWKHNYRNKPLSNNLLTRSMQPVEITSMSYVISLGVLRNSETIDKLCRIFNVDSIYDLSEDILSQDEVIDLTTGDYYNRGYYREFSVEALAKMFGVEESELTPELVENPTSEMMLHWLNYGNKFKYIQENVEITSAPIR